MELHDFQFFTLETLIIQTIILVLILWVLNRFIFKPYLSYLDKESEKRKKLENDYNNIEKLNKEAQEQKENLLSEARKQSEEIRKSGVDLAKKESQSIKEKAENEAKLIKESALTEIQTERQTMLNDVKGESVDLILKFNAKLFDKEQVNKDFVEKELSSLKKYRVY
ncbi:MAG: ATP synthase F0 subunit B [Candidatus Gracilibacteria bacterium]|nr:ATP synthase F0 subunit B [Candidatus Gracilibacteria bacterium]